VAEELILENGVPVVSDGAMQTIARLHSDHWAESIAAMAYARAEEARTNPSLIDNLKRKLSALLNNPPPERVGPSILKGIPARLLPRVRAIGNFRPLQQDYAREFGEWLRALAEKHTTPLVEESVPTAPLVPTSALGTPSGTDFARIELRWGESPRDLDLHVFIPLTEGGWRDINFMWTGTLEEWPWARLEGDVTTGGGPEVIIVKQAVPGLYRIAVQLYSHDASLAGSNAVLTLYMDGGMVRRFDCPATGDGVWWHVCDVDFLAQIVTEVNLICPSPFDGGPA
jgi:hypothetical protein